MNTHGVPKEQRPLAAVALAAGWSITKTKRNHFRWQAPTGEVTFSSCTTGDQRSALNLRSVLRRKGLPV